MKDKAEKESERLIELYYKNTDLQLTGRIAIECALIDVSNTIEVLEQLSIDDSGSIFRDFGHTFYYEVKKILEDKLN